MICNRSQLIAQLRKSLRGNEIWSLKLSAKNVHNYDLHLAVFREPYLSFIMDGRKRIETRFAKRPCPPFEGVAEGDVVILKPSGGKIVGIFEVERVWFYRLDPKSLAGIKDRFSTLICPVDQDFWTERESKSVATLMLIKNVASLNGVEIQKRDRRGWVTFNSERQQYFLPE